MADRIRMKVAEPLNDDEVHVWQLAYDRRDGRAPLLDLLAVYLGIDAEAVRLAEGAYGRPALDPAQAMGLDFNWSHSGDQALIAVARGIAPGVDLEQLRPRPQAMRIARRYFTAAETAALAVLEGNARDRAFLALWTAKEAVLKALGRGIAFGLHRLEIMPRRDGFSLQAIEGDEPAQWQLQPLATDPAYVAALAWRGGARHVRLRELAAPRR